MKHRMPSQGWLAQVEPWQVRKALYALASLIAAVAVIGGWVTQEQADGVLAQFDQISLALSTAVLALATHKTTAASDDGD